MDHRKHTTKYIVISVVFVLIIFALFFFKTNEIRRDLPVDTGIFADYGSLVGGILSAFFGLLGILLVIQTINDQEKQNELQNIESRFFELLKIQRENVLEFQQKGRTGRSVVIDIYDEYNILYNEVVESFPFDSSKPNSPEWEKKCSEVAYLILFFGVNNKSTKQLLKKIENIVGTEFYIKIYNDLLKQLINNHKTVKENNKSLKKGNKKYLDHDGQQSRLGHYYRHLYQTIKYIDEQPKKLLSYSEKYFYIKTLRAQLTTHEQAILFYNSLTYLGKEWEMNVSNDNRKLITKYNLIKNLPEGFTIVNPKDYYPDVFFESDTKKTDNRKKLEKKYE